MTTNLAFLKALLTHPLVVRGEIDTGFIEREISALTRTKPAVAALDLAAACVAVLIREQHEHEQASSHDSSPWNRTDGWTLSGRRSRRLRFRHGGEQYDTLLWYERDGFTMEFAGTNARLQFVPRDRGVFDMCLGDAPERASAAWSGRDLDVTTPRGHLKLEWIDPFAGKVADRCRGQPHRRADAGHGDPDSGRGRSRSAARRAAHRARSDENGAHAARPEQMAA